MVAGQRYKRKLIVMEKKKVLLVWWYDRVDLIEPFLSMQDEVEFTVLFYRFPEQEDKKIAEKLPFRRIYWLDYFSPYSILKEVKPEKVLFFGNESTVTISLIAAANIMKIDTCYLSHGLKGELSEIIAGGDTEQTIERYRKDNKYYTSKKWHTVLFLFLVMSFKNLKSISFVIEVLIAEFKIKNSFKKLLFIKNSLRKVKYYYLFAPENALMINELDSPNSNQIYYTGPYMMDPLFKEISNSTFELNKYWLIIDQPISRFKTEDRFELYSSIGKLAKKQEKKLIIKLHPMNYDINTVDTHDISWIKHSENLPQLIKDASGVIGYYSTLFLPIISFKKCILFETGSNKLTKKWNDLKVIKLLNLNELKIEDIDFDSFEVSETDRDNYIKQFVVFTDGNCTSRLKKLLVNNSNEQNA